MTLHKKRNEAVGDLIVVGTTTYRIEHIGDWFKVSARLTRDASPRRILRCRRPRGRRDYIVVQWTTGACSDAVPSPMESAS